MRNRQAVLAAAVAMGAVLSGCGAAHSDAPKSAPPAPSTAAVASPTPTPTESAAEKQRRLDFAAAEKSYRTFRKEYRRVLAAGGADRPTAVMKQTAGGPYLSELMEGVRSVKQIGAKQHGVETIRYLRRESYEAGAVGLLACEDGRDVTISAADKSYGDEGMRRVVLQVRRVGGAWKVWDGQGKKVTSCG